MTTTTVNFVLESLNSEVTMDLCGNLFSEEIPGLDVSATAVLYVSIDDMKSVFQFQTDSDDINNLADADIKYYVDNASWPILNPANAMLDVPGLSLTPIAISNSAGSLPSNKMMVCHDFTRYLASKLFGTHFGVDLFNNETELLQNLRLICDDDAVPGHTWNDITAKIIKVSKSGDHEGLAGDDGSQYMTNDTNDNTNLCRVLFNQLIKNDISRFRDISVGIDSPQPLPFLPEDSISFKLTISPASEQEALTGVEAFGGRSYEIKLVMVPALEVVNTVVADDEDDE
jgi:hypothetical protein